MSAHIQKHAPERGHTVGTTLYSPGCCCCCCCCLHSIGGLVGAVAVTATGARARSGEAPADSAVRRAAHWRIVTVYFVSLIVMTALAMLSEGDLEVGFWIAAIFFPGGQLAASLIGVGVALSSKDPPARRAALRTVGQLTLWSIVGALVGGAFFIPFS